MLHIILYAIVPIVAVMLLGFVAGRRGVFDAADAKSFNKVVLDYALPAALFVSIVQADRAMLVRDLRVTWVAVTGFVSVFLLVYVVFRRFKGNTGADAAVSALISGAPSIGFLGFAVLEPIFGSTLTVALVVAIGAIVTNPIIIPLGLTLMNSSLEHQHPTGRRFNPFKPVLKALAQPVAWAPLLAVVWVLAGVPWPQWASPSFLLIKGANASLAVFSAGITLSAIKLQINRQVITGVVFKMLIMPAVILGLGLLWHVDIANLKMLVACATIPAAFSGIIIADENSTYVADGTSALTLSVILFVIFCPLWQWVTGLVV